MVYKVPCMDCEGVYVGETRRCLRKKFMEHKEAVRRGDSNNGIVVHVHSNDHRINWDEARILEIESCYWKRRVLEAIWICKRTSTMNLDCGLIVNPIWSNQMLQLLNWDLSYFHLFLYLHFYSFFLFSHRVLSFPPWAPALSIY